MTVGASITDGGGGSGSTPVATSPNALVDDVPRAVGPDADVPRVEIEPDTVFECSVVGTAPVGSDVEPAADGRARISPETVSAATVSGTLLRVDTFDGETGRPFFVESVAAAGVGVAP
jgi:hypothetical protein